MITIVISLFMITNMIVIVIVILKSTENYDYDYDRVFVDLHSLKIVWKELIEDFLGAITTRSVVDYFHRNHIQCRPRHASLSVQM